jgi:hypothetical protein
MGITLDGKPSWSNPLYGDNPGFCLSLPFHKIRNQRNAGMTANPSVQMRLIERLIHRAVSVMVLVPELLD